MSDLPEEKEAAEVAAATLKIISPKVLASLLQEHSNNKTKVGEINGELAERLKHHKEFSNLNLKAFRVIATMNRMEPHERATFWDDLQVLQDIAHVELWRDQGHVGDLARMAEEERDAEAAAEMAAMEALVAENEKRLAKGIIELDPPPVGEQPRKSTRPAVGDAPGSYKLN